MKNTIHVFLFLIFISLNMHISALERDLEDNETLVTEDMSNVQIQDIIDSAIEGEVILFDVGSYDVNLVIDRSITLKGISTAHVILTNSAAKSILNISNAVDVTVQNFTFNNAIIGIGGNNSNVIVLNNIFTVGINNVAIQMDELSFFEIRNNTFNNIKFAIEVLNKPIALAVKNNIFSNFLDSKFLFTNSSNNSFTYNCFDAAVPSYSDSGFSQVVTDVGFSGGDKALENNQFQLTKDSPCIDQGEGNFDFDNTQTDTGAYGGKEADQYAFSIEDVVVTKKTESSVTVDWKSNEDYRVEGYKVYYDKLPLQDRETVVDRSILTAVKVEDATQISIDVENLDTSLDSFSTPIAPVLVAVEPRSKKLLVTWNKVEDATAYRIFYRAGSSAEVSSKDVDDTDNTEITGLSDGVSYTVWVTAISQFQYYFQVVAYLKPDEDEIEGLFINADTPYVIGTNESNPSLTKTAIPEAIEAYPNLPNEGCFIATAAFGYYSHQQVQILRDFRDNILLTNEIGTAFVTWYYEYGPIAAAFINKYDNLKPIVRVLLYPLIITAEIVAYDLTLFWLTLLVFLMTAIFIAKRLFLFSASHKRLRGSHLC